ncbi:response regulator transcription factor [Longitalea arenae]|uniref:response regulator transcription factor n=1 Tax=Longitalea arenae TaxID=2812558 RepID=UPI001F07C8F6|nr:LuxR C-terminal-related transcriptional regulator [Longitalea arenae]
MVVCKVKKADSGKTGAGRWYNGPSQKIPAAYISTVAALTSTLAGDAAIAAQLHLSPLTVEMHRRNLMQKFNIKSMTAAVKVAMEKRDDVTKGPF